MGDAIDFALAKKVDRDLKNYMYYRRIPHGACAIAGGLEEMSPTDEGE